MSPRGKRPVSFCAWCLKENTYLYRTLVGEDWTESNETTYKQFLANHMVSHGICPKHEFEQLCKIEQLEEEQRELKRAMKQLEEDWEAKHGRRSDADEGGGEAHEGDGEAAPDAGAGG